MISQNKILFIIFFISIWIQSFCQKDSLTNKKNYFYIIAGINNSVPKEKNYNYFYDNSLQTDDGQTYNFDVFSLYSIKGGGVSLGFQYPVFKINNVKISIGSDVGIDFYHDRIIKVGTLSGGLFAYNFKGIIYNTNNFYNMSLNIVTSLTYLLNKNIILTFYLGSGIDYNLLNTYKTTEKDILLNTKDNTKGNIYGDEIFYYISNIFRFEISKEIKMKNYGIFIGTKFFGKKTTSHNSYNEMQDNVQEFVHRYFILNYGIIYKY